MAIRGILFDKDGTLFDFEASWSEWAAGLFVDLAEGDPDLTARLSDAAGFDLARRRFLPASPFIAGTLAEVAELLAPFLPTSGQEELMTRINAAAADAPMVPLTCLGPLLADLRSKGLSLGVATNASEIEAWAHLVAAGVSEAFDFLAGFDSGYGAKPGPGMCHAFADHMGLSVEEVVMVGDSLHDLHAGRAAGMKVVGVLTGLAPEAELAPHADSVLPSIAHLPAWLTGDGATATGSGTAGSNTTQSVAI